MAKRGRPTLDEVLSDVKKAKAQKTKVKRTLKTKEAQIKKLETTLNNKKNSLKKSKEVLSKLFQQMVGEEIANIGFDYVNGTRSSLEPIRNILDNYQDDFTPSFKFSGDDISFNTLIEHLNLKFQWKFNIPSLARRVEGVSGGHFVIVGARPNTGKTSFHASILASKGGFIDQGAKCVVLCNEESYKRVGLRYLYCKSNMTSDEVLENSKLAI